MMEIKDRLLMNVSGACQDGLQQLSACNNKNEMMECFFDRIDYCLAKNFPSKEIIAKEFHEEAREHSVYIDQEVTIEGDRRSVLLGKCCGTLIAGEFTVCRVYVKHDSTLKVRASGNAIVIVDALDNAKIDVECADSAKVNVYLYSKATSTGATKTVHKNRETYEL